MLGPFKITIIWKMVTKSTNFMQAEFDWPWYSVNIATTALQMQVIEAKLSVKVISIAVVWYRNCWCVFMLLLSLVEMVVHYLCSCVLKSFEIYFKILGKGVLWIYMKVLFFIVTDTVGFFTIQNITSRELCCKTCFSVFCGFKLFCFLLFDLKQGEIIHDIAIK